MSWTEERVSKLVELWGKGMSASEIADSIGEVSRNAVIGKAHRLGLSTRTKKDFRRAVMATPTLICLNDKKCKWPIGDPKESDFHFCSSTVHETLPYCAKHAAIAYQPATRKKFDLNKLLSA